MFESLSLDSKSVGVDFKVALDSVRLDSETK